MKYALHDFLGSAIYDKETRHVIARVGDPVINPTNGEIVAFHIRSNQGYILPTVDIQRVVKNTIWVASADAICPSTDIVRIQAIIDQKIPIINNHVIDLSRQKLGRVIDIVFETNGWVMTQLDVAKKILNIPTERKLIDTRQIVRITAQEITVQDMRMPIEVCDEKRVAAAPKPEPSTCKSK